MGIPSSFFDVLRSVESAQSPALVWYSVPGERVELSGRVLMNWVAKTANMLDEELDFSDDSSAVLAMGPHWRSLAVGLAALVAGGCVGFERGQQAALFFSDDPGQLAEALESDGFEYVVAVDRGPLSARFMGALPSDALDFCASVRSFGDVYFPLLPAAASAPALVQGSEVLSHGQALARLVEARELALTSAESSFLFHGRREWNADLLLTLLGIIAAGKTVVLCDPGLDFSQERLERICSDERAVLA